MKGHASTVSFSRHGAHIIVDCGTLDSALCTALTVTADNAQVVDRNSHDLRSKDTLDGK